MAKKKAKGQRFKRNYRKKQRNTSIFFLLWTAFSVVLLLIVVLFGVSQRVSLKQAYRKEAAREVTERGHRVEAALVAGPPEWLGGNMNAFVRLLARENNVSVFVLNVQGDVLFPMESGLDPSDPEFGERFDFGEEIVDLKNKLSKTESGFVVYENDDGYAYGTKILLEGQECYLYLYDSMEIMEEVQHQVGLQTVFVGVFVLILSFAVSLAISGWIVKPISEMTEKAKRFAEGDFNIDFSGSDYGSEMVELAHALNFARDEISKADRMQKDLIANVSHDFKTPLTMIKAYSSMIIEISGNNPEKRKKHAQVIIDEADRLTSLVEDVLDLSKISAGINAIELDTFDLSAYLSEILERFSYLKDTDGYAFEREIAGGVTVRADKKKIGQAIYNLIGNAVNYTGDDKKVSVRLKKLDGVAEFTVTDTGAGISEEERANIWERYYRSSETHKRPVKGTGLGLSIVKTVLEKHGFLFGARSGDFGVGTTFYILFPLELEKDVKDG